MSAYEPLLVVCGVFAGGIIAGILFHTSNFAGIGALAGGFAAILIDHAIHKHNATK